MSLPCSNNAAAASRHDDTTTCRFLNLTRHSYMFANAHGTNLVVPRARDGEHATLFTAAAPQSSVLVVHVDAQGRAAEQASSDTTPLALDVAAWSHDDADVQLLGVPPLSDARNAPETALFVTHDVGAHLRAHPTLWRGAVYSPLRDETRAHDPQTPRCVALYRHKRAEPSFAERVARAHEQALDARANAHAPCDAACGAAEPLGAAWRCATCGHSTLVEARCDFARASNHEP